jgi:hypothetical protein
MGPVNSPRSNRRRLRFTIAGLLLAFAAIAPMLAYVGQHYRRDRLRRYTAYIRFDLAPKADGTTLAGIEGQVLRDFAAAPAAVSRIIGELEAKGLTRNQVVINVNSDSSLPCGTLIPAMEVVTGYGSKANTGIKRVRLIIHKRLSSNTAEFWSWGLRARQHSSGIRSAVVGHVGRTDCYFDRQRVCGQLRSDACAVNAYVQRNRAKLVVVIRRRVSV